MVHAVYVPRRVSEPDSAPAETRWSGRSRPGGKPEVVTAPELITAPPSTNGIVDMTTIKAKSYKVKL